MESTRGTYALAEEYWGGSSFRWNDKRCLGVRRFQPSLIEPYKMYYRRFSLSRE
jgi:hypothetical protein